MKKEDDYSQGKRGALVKVPPGKRRITLSIESDVLDWFSDQLDAAGRGSFQAFINEALREYIASQAGAAGRGAATCGARGNSMALPSHWRVVEVGAVSGGIQQHGSAVSFRQGNSNWADLGYGFHRVQSREITEDINAKGWIGDQK
jgi:hypothetical protein